MPKPKLEPDLLQKAPLRYAPTNELGVVFLFSFLCRRMQLHVESIQAGFPDCIARQRVGGNERRIRIEFEFRSSNYRAHRHPIDGCDWIVCWEHDWPGVPPNLKVAELRRYFAQGFNVWMESCPCQEKWPARGKYAFSHRVAKGDLVLVYEYSPKSSIQHIYTVGGAVEVGGVEDHNGWLLAEAMGLYQDSWGGLKKDPHPDIRSLRRVCILEPALPADALRADKLIQLNQKMTEHWWRLYELIVRRNPNGAAALERFSPSKV